MSPIVMPRNGTELLLLRNRFTPRSTIGTLFFEGKPECFILEPPRRTDDVKPRCIPAGRYEIRITTSPRFGVLMPILCEVPGFQGVRIHVGNKPEDTEACWCPGTRARTDFVEHSTVAYNELYEKLKRAPGPIFVTIQEEL
jgi:hypothetical protein